MSGTHFKSGIKIPGLSIWKRPWSINTRYNVKLSWPFFSFCYRISAQGTNIRTEPKHIVFLSQLLLLFGFCHSCKADNPQVDVHEVGTQVVVTTTCSNPKCQKPKGTWQSQPFLPGSKLPAGNFLLCLAILLAGGSASKVFRIFSHMGLGCLSMNTFFRYQRVSILQTNISTV